MTRILDFADGATSGSAPVISDLDTSGSFVVYADSDADDGGDGSQLLPFNNLQDAVDLTETAGDSQRRVISIAGGSAFDHDINSSGGNLSVLGLGPWTLGDAVNSDFSSTTPRSWTWSAGPDTGSRPMLIMSQASDNETSTTYAAAAGGADISGDFLIEDGVNLLPMELILNSVKIRGSFDAETGLSTTIVNAYFNKCFFDSTFLGLNLVAMATCYNCEFDSSVRIKSYCRICDSELSDGMLSSDTITNTMPPQGIYDTSMKGEFSGPAGLLLVDQASNYFYVQNSATLGGSATKVLLEGFKDEPQTQTNKILTSAVLDGTISGTSIKDEDNLVSDSSDHLVTQQSVKAYIDNAVAGAGGELVSTKSTDYTVLDGDGITTLLIDDTSTDRIVTLPTAADNTNRKIKIKNISTDKGKITIEGEGAETVEGFTNITLDFKNSFTDVQCDGAGWHIVAQNITAQHKSYSITTTATGWTATKAESRPYRDISGTWFHAFNIHGTITSSSRSSLSVNITGISQSGDQSISAWSATSAAKVDLAYAQTSSSNIFIRHTSATTSEYYFSGDVELASKPTYVE